MTLRSFDRLALMALIPITALALLACDALTGGDSSQCVPGESRQCHCADGKAGRQVCAQDGKSLGECECAGAAKTDGGVVPTMPPPPAVPEAPPGVAPVPPGTPPPTATGPTAPPPPAAPAIDPTTLPPAPPPGPATDAMSSPFEPDQATLALWHFDDGSGQAASDNGINGLNGVIRGSTWAAGRFSGALQFNGSNASVQAAAHDGLFPTKAITVEAWIRPEAPGNMTIYDVQDTQGLALRPRGSDVEVVFTLRLNDTVRTLVSTTPVAVQQWHHVAGTYDGVNLRLWIDGDLQGELNAPGALSRARLCDTPTIGSNCPASGGWFNGIIDEIRVSSLARYVPQGTDIPGGVAGTDSPDGGPADAGTKTKRSKRGLNPVDFAKKRAQDARRILGI